MAKPRKTGKGKTKTAKTAKHMKHTAAAKPAEALEAVVPQTEPEREPAPTRSIVVAASLRSWNKWLAVVHALQGAAILVLSATHTFPVTVSFYNTDPIASGLAGHPVLAQASKHLFEINLALLVAACFFLSAIAHALAASWHRDTYEADLQRGINKLRWMEFGLSAGTIFVILGLLSGVGDLASLVMMLAFGVVAGAAGLIWEYVKPASPNWLVCSLGVAAGLVPWFVLGLYAWGAGVYGTHVPNFVYGLYGSMLLFFAGFVANSYMQYKQKGRWADYLYGERVYMLLSLAAKIALAWQIFAGTLHS